MTKLPIATNRGILEFEPSEVAAPTDDPNDPYWQAAYSEALKTDLCLFAKVVLGLEIGPHVRSWGDLIQTHRRIAINAARDHGKSSIFSYAYPIWRAWSEPGCEVYLFSNTVEQASEFLDIIVYGRNNLKGMVEIESLKALIPDQDGFRMDPRLRLNRTDLRMTNGSRIRTVGYSKAVRGRHPRYIVLDDVLNDEDMFSETVRNKNISYFQSAIVNMATPDAQIIVVGCVTEDTWVPTENGLRQIGSLRPGEKAPQTLHDLDLRVHGRNGLQTATKFWDNGVTPTKRVTLQSGHAVEGSHKHPVLVMPESGVPEWRRLDALAEGDYVAVHVGAECWGQSGLTPDEAYLIGLWIAEGSSERGRLTITNPEPEIQEWLLTHPRWKFTCTDGLHVRCSSVALLKQFEDWGVSWAKAHGKRIPKTIMEGSRENAVAFLQGYFDGDGCAAKEDERKMPVTFAASVSEGLIDDVHALLGNLGIWARKSAKVIQSTKIAPNGGGTIFWVTMHASDAVKFQALPGFRLPRKRRDQTSDHTPKIPHQRALIRGMMDAKPRRKRGAVATAAPFNVTEFMRADKSRVTSLSKAADWYESHGASGPAVDQIRANVRESENLRWSEVVKIEDAESYVVDFVVPEGNSFISNGIVSHNTPYHANDLYAWLQKNPVYAFARYPGIVKTKTGEERALFPWRWSLDALKGKREEIGALAFTREILCLPISDDLSVFPRHLFPPLYDNSLTLRPTKEEIQARGLSVFMGVDIARSANVGADYFVVFVVGADKHGNHHIIDIRRTKGLAFQAQLNEIATAAELYDPGLIFIESNAMQQIYTQEMRRMTDLPVKEFVTHASNKYPMDSGVPGLRILVENKKFVIPRGDDYSVQMTDIWINEAASFGFVDGRLQGIGAHDDTVMAWWMACEAKKAGGFSFGFGDDDGADAPEDEVIEGEGRWEDVLYGDPTDASDVPF